MIAVVCAHNPGRRNLGMYSVDLAAQQFFSVSGWPFELVKFTGHARVGRLRYRVLGSAEELDSYETIVFWGDFQQHPLWGRRNFGPRHARKHRTTIHEGFRCWKEKCLMMDRIRRPGQRWFSVGTCFLGVLAELGDVAAIEEYVTLLSRFDAIVPRDWLSAAELRSCALTNVVPGLDCATLLDHGDAPPSGAPTFGYAFGRTLSSVEGRRLAREIERRTGQRGMAIDWLLGKHIAPWCNARYTRALSTIRRCRYIVTDVYHLAITALNIGRNVFCIGSAGLTQEDTCDDLKKAVLFRMADLSDRYLEIPVDAADRVAYVVSRFREPVGEAVERGRAFRSLRVSSRQRLQSLFYAEHCNLDLSDGIPVELSSIVHAGQSDQAVRSLE